MKYWNKVRSHFLEGRTQHYSNADMGMIYYGFHKLNMTADYFEGDLVEYEADTPDDYIQYGIVGGQLKRLVHNGMVKVIGGWTPTFTNGGHTQYAYFQRCNFCGSKYPYLGSLAARRKTRLCPPCADIRKKFMLQYNEYNRDMDKCRAKERRRYQRRKAERKEYEKKWRAKNKDELKIRKKVYHEQNKVWLNKRNLDRYYKDHAESKRKRNEYYNKNHDVMLAKARAYTAKHRERIRKQRHENYIKRKSQ